MRTLVVEDDYITSQVMQEIMLSFGECDIAEDGKTAFDLFIHSYNNKTPYNIIFLDIMMPELDGQEVLEKIRSFESENFVMGLDCVKIVMTTALSDYDNIRNSFMNQCEGYLVKPADKDKVVKILTDFELL